MSKKSLIPLFVLAIIWSVFFVAVKVSVTSLPTFAVGVYVRTFTLFALLGYMAFQKSLFELKKIKNIWPWLLLIGLLGFGVDITSFIGMGMTTLLNASLLLKLDVIFANFITVIIFRQRLTAFNWVSTIITLIGVLIVLNVNIFDFQFTGWGDLLLIGSSLMVTINAFVIKTLQKHKSGEVKSEVIAFYNNFVTLTLFTLVLFLTGQENAVETIYANPILLLPLTVAGIGQTLIYIVYYRVLRSTRVWIVKLCLLTIPMISTIIAFFLLGEDINIKQIIGMILVISGAVLTLKYQVKSPEKAI